MCTAGSNEFEHDAAEDRPVAVDPRLRQRLVGAGRRVELAGVGLPVDVRIVREAGGRPDPPVPSLVLEGVPGRGAGDEVPEQHLVAATVRVGRPVNVDAPAVRHAKVGPGQLHELEGLRRVVPDLVCVEPGEGPALQLRIGRVVADVGEGDDPAGRDGHRAVGLVADTVGAVGDEADRKDFFLQLLQTGPALPEHKRARVRAVLPAVVDKVEDHPERLPGTAPASIQDVQCPRKGSTACWKRVGWTSRAIFFHSIYNRPEVFLGHALGDGMFICVLLVTLPPAIASPSRQPQRALARKIAAMVIPFLA